MGGRWGVIGIRNEIKTDGEEREEREGEIKNQVGERTEELRSFNLEAETKTVKGFGGSRMNRGVGWGDKRFRFLTAEPIGLVVFLDCSPQLLAGGGGKRRRWNISYDADTKGAFPEKDELLANWPPGNLERG